LPDIAVRFGLSFEGAINLDSLVDEGDGEIGRSVALGTIGKLLPSALVVGQAVHASNSLQGLNAGGASGRDRGGDGMVGAVC
jgi:arginine utilization protein RocB